MGAVPHPLISQPMNMKNSQGMESGHNSET